MRTFKYFDALLKSLKDYFETTKIINGLVKERRDKKKLFELMQQK